MSDRRQRRRDVPVSVPIMMARASPQPDGD